MSCENQFITPMPEFCILFPCCRKDKKDRRLIENRYGFMICPLCKKSYGERNKEMSESNVESKPIEEPQEDLSLARLTSFGAYRPLYDIEAVGGMYGGKPAKVWRGRPVIEPRHDKVPGAKERMESDWIYFTREYDERNDWDLMYHEIELDSSLIGVPIILVPKEKLLFAYAPPPKGGILLPTRSIQLPKGGVN